MPALSPDPAQTPDEELADLLGKFYADPLGHVMFSYPWDTEPSIQVVKLEEPWKSRYGVEFGPDVWACEFMEELGTEIKRRRFDGVNAVEPIRFATVSGHGIGKSTIAAWLIKFIMDTRPEAKGTVTAVTDTQLQSRTWAELVRWHKLSMTSHLFEVAASRGNMSMWYQAEEGKFKEVWKVQAKTCRPEKSEGFAGQHAPTSTSFYLLDEASGVDNKIYEVLEGGLSDGEPMVFLFGNGTRNSGEFYEACTSPKSKYRVRSIDSRDVAITNKAKIQEDMEAWVGGEDGDRFRARWRGLFPKKGNQQFIDSKVVDEAGERQIPRVDEEPMILGVDVARFGDDDTVVWPRRGNDARTWSPAIGQGLDTNKVVDMVVRQYNKFMGLEVPVGAIFVDEGYNPGVLDLLRNLGYPVFGVQFGGSATDLETYRYRVDEMWGHTRDALANGLCIPSRSSRYGDRLYSELTQREYGFTLSGQIRLESKQEMKKRGLASPDYADALALTFAMPVASMRSVDPRQRARNAPTVEEWHPHDELKDL